MFAERFVIPVTTASDGSATVYSPVFTGAIKTLRYVKTDFADGVDFTITLEGTGETVWTETNVNAAKTVAPRIATHDNAGAASLYAAGGEPVETEIIAVKDRLKIIIAAGGDTKTGAFHLTVG